MTACCNWCNDFTGQMYSSSSSCLMFLWGKKKKDTKFRVLRSSSTVWASYLSWCLHSYSYCHTQGVNRTWETNKCLWASQLQRVRREGLHRHWDILAKIWPYSTAGDTRCMPAGHDREREKKGGTIMGWSQKLSKCKIFDSFYPSSSKKLAQKLSHSSAWR